MATTIEKQVALDEALVPRTKRLRIGRSNFRLPSDIQSNESTLQVIYDVLRISPFFKAFLVTADVPEIYMQEFWATSYVHQHSIIFKMDSRKNIVDLEAFREMLHISPRVPCQSFDELPFEEEILDFLRFLGYSAQITTLFDKHRLCLSNLGRFCVSSGTQESKEEQRDVLPQIHKSHHPSLHDEETFNPKMKQDIRNTKAYKEYYACATGEAEPKPKASARRKRGGSDSFTTPLTAVASPRPITTHGGSSKDEGTGSKPGVLDVPSDDSEEEISWNSSDDEDVDAQDKGRDDDEGKKNDESDDRKDDDDDEESFDLIPRTPKDKEEADELYRDVDINKGRGLQVYQDIEDSHVTLTLVKPDGQQESSSVSSFVTSMLNSISDASVESIFTTASSLIAPLQTP
nr:hypothetical protein [Tanacetum cinerariifolium]